MDSIQAFAMGEANRGKELMVFDWDKAATIMRERNVENASAGLQNDWEWTGGAILRNGKPVPKGETYTYLASTWARPEIEFDGKVEECWLIQSQTPGWDDATYWPESALKILGYGNV